MTSSIALPVRHVNLALLGLPGSGKGSYGRLLSKLLHLPLITVSDVIRQQHPNAAAADCGGHHVGAHLQTGKLVDDETVSNIVARHLMEQMTAGGYILDGFPRTAGQIELMRQSWPASIQLEGAIALDVPMEVCRQKILGRRHCNKCGQHFNTAHVQHGDFDLPAQPPRHAECFFYNNKDHDDDDDDKTFACCESVYWTTRPDDVTHIVQHRLDTHEAHARPVLKHFRQQKRLLSFSPVRGYDDMPRFELEIQKWLEEWKRDEDFTVLELSTKVDASSL